MRTKTRPNLINLFPHKFDFHSKKIFGAPWLNEKLFSDELNGLHREPTGQPANRPGPLSIQDRDNFHPTCRGWRWRWGVGTSNSLIY